MLHWILISLAGKATSMCEAWEAFPLEMGLEPDEQILLFSWRYHILSTHSIGNCISNSCALTNCTVQFRQWFCCVHDPYWVCFPGVGKALFVNSELQKLFMHRGDIADIFFSNGFKVSNWSTPYFLQESWTVWYCLSSKTKLSFGESFC